MYLHVDIAATPPAVELRDRENLGELSIRGTGEPDTDRLRTSLAPFARLDDVDHAYIYVSALRALAGDNAQNVDRRKAFDDMTNYTRAHGWVDQDGAIRAHMETED